jgi:hypothetical protein
MDMPGIDLSWNGRTLVTIIKFGAGRFSRSARFGEQKIHAGAVIVLHTLRSRRTINPV